MNEYMRFRAGSLHPNPHVHKLWWNKYLHEHRLYIRNLESPIKKYIMKPSGTIPKKLHSSRSQVVGGTRPRSRPQSAATNRDASRGRPGSRPQSAQQMARPMSAGHLQRPQQWDPFRGAVDDPAARYQVGGQQQQTPAGFRPSPSRQMPQPSRPGNADLMLQKVANSFHVALEDLDTVEAEMMASNKSIASKKRFAALKIQVADLGKQVDLIRDELQAGGP